MRSRSCSGKWSIEAATKANSRGSSRFTSFVKSSDGSLGFESERIVGGDLNRAPCFPLDAARRDGRASTNRNDNKSLGVRTQDENASNPDVVVVDGMVEPGRHGMSVAPRAEAEDLPSFLIPRRFKGKHRRGSGVPKGNNQLICWRAGDGAFADAKFADHLMFWTDPKRSTEHGFIAPEFRCTLSEYRSALAVTLTMWALVPWPWEADS